MDRRRAPDAGRCGTGIAPTSESRMVRPGPGRDPRRVDSRFVESSQEQRQAARRLVEAMMSDDPHATANEGGMVAAQAAPPPPTGSLWRDLADAIRGTGADYTKIPLRRAVFLLAVPMVLELVLESTFAVVDIWFVARLGPLRWRPSG